MLREAEEGVEAVGEVLGDALATVLDVLAEEVNSDLMLSILELRVEESGGHGEEVALEEFREARNDTEQLTNDSGAILQEIGFFVFFVLEIINFIIILLTSLSDLNFSDVGNRHFIDFVHHTTGVIGEFGREAARLSLDEDTGSGVEHNLNSLGISFIIDGFQNLGDDVADVVVDVVGFAILDDAEDGFENFSTSFTSLRERLELEQANSQIREGVHVGIHVALELFSEVEKNRGGKILVFDEAGVHAEDLLALARSADTNVLDLVSVLELITNILVDGFGIAIRVSNVHEGIHDFREILENFRAETLNHTCPATEDVTKTHIILSETRVEDIQQVLADIVSVRAKCGESDIGGSEGGTLNSAATNKHGIGTSAGVVEIVVAAVDDISNDGADTSFRELNQCRESSEGFGVDEYRFVGLEAREDGFRDGAEVVVHEASRFVALLFGESLVVFIFFRFLGVIEFVKDGEESGGSESHDTRAVVQQLVTDDGEEDASVGLLEGGAEISRELSDALHGAVADVWVRIIETWNDDLTNDGVEVSHEGLQSTFEDVAEESESSSAVTPVVTIDVGHDTRSSELFHDLATDNVRETISTLSASIII